MPEQIRDYITGQLLPLTSEEAVRQEFERILIDEMGYPRSHMDIEFPIQRGSKRRSERADIVIFRDEWRDQKNIYMIVEIESPGHPFDDQVFSYATATTAEFVVWFDGLDRKKSQGAKYFNRDMATDPTKFVEIPTLPRSGESIEEIGKYRKSQLQELRS